MTDDEATAVVWVEMRLEGVHPSWIKHARSLTHLYDDAAMRRKVASGLRELMVSHDAYKTPRVYE